MARSIALVIAGVIAGALACAMPGRPVQVLPAVQGRIDGLEPSEDARVRLVVMHRETPSLHARREIEVDDGGGFRFEPISLDVAGHEFSKHYRVYLHLRSVETDRVIWRADVSRRKAHRAIVLDCDRARPAALGEVCRVREPLRQPWLLAEGQKSFERLCTSCHGPAGRALVGSATMDPDAAGMAPPDLTQISARHGGHFDHDRVAAWIEGRSLPAHHARGGMPIWGERLSSEFERYAEGDELIGATLDPLVAYLESLQVEAPE